MIDAIARRYMVLPSQLLAQGDTFDLLVMDVGATYEQHIQSKHSKTPGDNSRFYNQEDLQERMNKFRTG